MSWDVEPKKEKTPTTLEEVIQKIENNDSPYKPVDLTNCVFEEAIKLDNRTIPCSLDFRYSIFKDSLSFHFSTMEGTYIELTGVELQKGVYFTALKGTSSGMFMGYGIYLRKAKIFGDIGLNGAGPISTLSIYDNDYYDLRRGKEYVGAGLIRTAGAEIERIIVKGEEDLLV